MLERRTFPANAYLKEVPSQDAYLEVIFLASKHGLWNIKDGHKLTNLPIADLKPSPLITVTFVSVSGSALNFLEVLD